MGRFAIALGLLLAVGTLAKVPAFGQAGNWSNPSALCRAIGNIDDPARDRRYHGPKTFPSGVRAAGLQPSDKDLLTWRCMDGRIWACAQWSTVSCMRAPWTTPRTWAYLLRDPDVRAQCRREPNAECAGATHCTAGCSSGRPKINGPDHATDRFGYDPSEWKPVVN